jgi:hypothetical protein
MQRIWSTCFSEGAIGEAFMVAGITTMVMFLRLSLFYRIKKWEEFQIQNVFNVLPSQESIVSISFGFRFLVEANAT